MSRYVGIAATVLGGVLAVGSVVASAFDSLADVPLWFVAECAGCLVCGWGLRLWIEGL